MELSFTTRNINVFTQFFDSYSFRLVTFLKIEKNVLFKTLKYYLNEMSGLY